MLNENLDFFMMNLFYQFLIVVDDTGVHGVADVVVEQGGHAEDGPHQSHQEYGRPVETTHWPSTHNAK